MQDFNKLITPICDRFTPDKDKPCVFYIKPGLCSLPSRFRCIEYINRFEPILSHSAVQAFLRCRRLFYYSDILGIQPIDSMANTALVRGKWMHKGLAILFDKATDGEDVDAFMQDLYDSSLSPQDIIRIEALLRFIQSKNLHIPAGQPEAEFTTLVVPGAPRIHGFIDVKGGGWMYEFKYTTRPDTYMNPLLLKSQLTTYFLSDLNLRFAIMKPIRVPIVRMREKDSEADYRERLWDDINRRPAFYFPNYSEKDGKAGWGSVILREEVDKEEYVLRLKAVGREIRDMVRNRSYYRNDTACFFPQPCPYIPICETGGISKLLYQPREDKVYEGKGLLDEDEVIEALEKQMRKDLGGQIL